MQQIYNFLFKTTKYFYFFFLIPETRKPMGFNFVHSINYCDVIKNKLRSLFLYKSVLITGCLPF